jgi:hypothetical protein
VTVDNEHFDKLNKELKSKDSEISYIKQKTNKLQEDLKWANMLGSPSIHIFNLESEITNDYLENRLK